MNYFMPRGIRNNNPGNIRLSRTRWRGQKELQRDTEFVEFDDAVSGLRALMRVLLTYYIKYQLNTVASIICRWAPPHENATDHYIHQVAKIMKVRRDDIIDISSQSILATLAKAITWQENGQPPAPVPAFWYDEAIFDSAAEIALSSLTPA